MFQLLTGRSGWQRTFLFSAEYDGEISDNEDGKRKQILVLPPEEETMIQYEAKSNDYLLERLKVLKTVVKVKTV